jgi:glycosyltransferase involved in cell wall biosynthesis
MRVSIVIPTYNGADFVRATLETVFAQTYTDFDVVVSDDGSTDQTLGVVESFDDPRLRVVDDRSHVGAARNWDRALSHAEGEYVKILAQDDLLYPENLAVQVDALDASEALSFVAVRRDIIGADGTVLLRDRGLSGLCGQVTLVNGSRRTVRSGANQFGEGAAVMFRREAARTAGSFDESAQYTIDIDYWLRLLSWGPAYGICNTHAAFRVNAQSWSNELVRKQGQQYAAMINRIAADPEREVSNSDVRVGKVRATVNAALRRVFYLRYRSHL